MFGKDDKSGREEKEERVKEGRIYETNGEQKRREERK